VWIKKKELEALSSDIRKIIDGQTIDLRDNREGVFSRLKNDVHTLANLKNEQVDILHQDRESLSNTLADISHQLKTPLTSMIIMVDLIENAPPEKQLEFIANIRKGLTQMEWMVSALLKMAKLDAGAIEFKKQNASSNELLKHAMEPLQILLDVKSQKVESIGEAELFCDKRWTAEALTNIIKNASEYSPEGSVIRIESGTNPISNWISVTDRGSGIPRNEMAKLFTRFQGSRSEKGYGIGLPLAFAIMRGQGGDIEVDGGGNGLGATFTLKFFPN
jgi:signal transduction histidine kinase